MQNGVFVPVLSFGGASGASGASGGGASGGGASGASGGGPSISMGAADDNNSNNLKSASGGAFKSIQLGGTFAYWHARNNAQLEHIDALETLTESLKEENANLKKQLDTGNGGIALRISDDGQNAAAGRGGWRESRRRRGGAGDSQSGIRRVKACELQRRESWHVDGVVVERR
ncbi:hypothetical protein PPROV_000201800 [Pycnococcus provasolii]|uniref:Uncharacterized protein n=1 Tax=Pycnococcus provasolii TaxID=41880 RepID=A0A830HA08_9CHLO|nr:hypothetical protein PPROV_000201800 [Pycnococcus provasolii]